MKILTILGSLCLFVACQAEHIDSVPDVSEATIAPATQIGEIITVTGQLISTICFGDENPENHDTSLECATKHTEEGMPIALLEPGKPAEDAWILLTVPQIFSDYMGQTVRVTGDIRSEGVLNPTRVEWQKEDDWVFIM